MNYSGDATTLLNHIKIEASAILAAPRDHENDQRETHLATDDRRHIVKLWRRARAGDVPAEYLSRYGDLVADNASVLAELIRARRARRGVFWTVAIYMIDRAYGGPEEGGWWYGTGVLCDARVAAAGEHGVPRTFASEADAFAWAAEVNTKLDATANKGRREISSVLSEGRYAAQVCAGWPETHYPKTRPHYE